MKGAEGGGPAEGVAGGFGPIRGGPDGGELFPAHGLPERASTRGADVKCQNPFQAHTSSEMFD